MGVAQMGVAQMGVAQMGVAELGKQKSVSAPTAFLVRCLFYVCCSSRGNTNRRHERFSHRTENSESEFCSGLQRATSQV